jgi:hypothetical protein
MDIFSNCIVPALRSCITQNRTAILTIMVDVLSIGSSGNQIAIMHCGMLENALTTLSIPSATYITWDINNFSNHVVSALRACITPNRTTRNHGDVLSIRSSGNQIAIALRVWKVGKCIDCINYFIHHIHKIGNRSTAREPVRFCVHTNEGCHHWKITVCQTFHDIYGKRLIWSNY